MKLIDKINFRAPVLFALSAALLGLAGCVKNPSPNEGGEETDNLPVFNFSTRATYTLNLNYGTPAGYKVYFEVYPENPLTTDADGVQTKNNAIEAIDKGYTDDKGVYSCKITIPVAVETLYIYTPNVGVPQLLTVKVENGTLGTASVPGREAAAASKAATRAGNMVDKYNYPNIKTILFGQWEHYVDGYLQLPNIPAPELYGRAKIWGRPNYLTYVDQRNFTGGEPALSINAAIWNTINKALPGEGKGEVNPEILKSGDIHVTKEAEIDLYLLDEQCLYVNVLAYYCYPTGNPPASAADIKTQAIVFPNAKIIRAHNAPFPGSGDIYDYGALRPGEGVRLHYIDENGVDQGTTFPPNTSIGWILYSDGYQARSYPDGQLTAGRSAIYSDAKLMNSIPHVAVFRHGDFVVTSFEDGLKSSSTDTRDYNDLIFHVGSTPADAITPGIPDVDPDQPDDTKVVSEVTYRGILSFEDNWPYRGDFDMNDVVVKYVSKIGYNIKNQVLESTDDFTVLWSGAKYNNSFAYQNENISKGSATVDAPGMPVDVQNNIVRVAARVLDYANTSDKKSFKVSYKYTSPIAKGDFAMPPYNPFITVESVDSREVHLTNLKPTDKLDTKWLGFGHDKSKPEQGLYYITYDEQLAQMPFAIDVAFDSDEELNLYVIPKETEHINTYYPGFMKWVSSGGKTDKDWYLHPIK